MDASDRSPLVPTPNPSSKYGSEDLKDEEAADDFYPHSIRYQPELDAESMFSPPKPSQHSWLIGALTSGASSRIKRTRLVDRDGAFEQSRGRLSVRKKVKIRDWRTLFVGDWFHSLIDMPTYKCIAILLCVYILIVLLFAIPYYRISIKYQCNMGIENFFEAFVFALQTQATIGYGTQDIFFGDCWMPVLALTTQICIKIIIDAIAIGVIYSRLSRPQSRASTILFSKNSVIKYIDGKLCLIFRICELRKHQLIGSQIRLYAVKLERSHDSSLGSDWHYNTYPMRVHHPDDTLGSMLLMAFPQYILHYIDEKSPLNPDSDISKLMKSIVSRHGNDSSIGSNNLSSSRNNSSNNTADIDDKWRGESTTDDASFLATPTPDASAIKDQLTQHWDHTNLEIVAVLEGVDPTTAGSLQARHSYVASEVAWFKTFAPCVFHDSDDGTAVIDFSKFHDTY